MAIGLHYCKLWSSHDQRRHLEGGTGHIIGSGLFKRRRSLKYTARKEIVEKITGDNLKQLKKRMLFIAAICACLAGFYWLKNASGINLVSDFSLSAYFPFSLLKLEPSVHYERGSVTIDEDFESLLPIPIKWWKVHTPAPDSIWTDYVKTGPESSRCLMVTSLSDQRWHITHRYRMAVRKNDRLYLEGMLWSKSNGGYAAVQVSGFDAQGQIIERNMWHIESSIQGRFEKIKGVFTVAPGVTSIRLRLAGKGPGEFKFDNILLQPLVTSG